MDLQSVWKLERIGLNPVALVEGFVKCFCSEREALSRALCVTSSRGHFACRSRFSEGLWESFDVVCIVITPCLEAQRQLSLLLLLKAFGLREI